MRFSTYTKIYLLLFLIISGYSLTTNAANNNNSYVFNGTTGYAYIEDNDPITSDANQSAYGYFDNPAYSNDSISVEAWVYLLGDNPGVEMPVIYRGFDDGYKTFSLYIKDGVAHFSIGNGSIEVNTAGQGSIPAFAWVHLAATYDGQTLTLYYGGDPVDVATGALGSGHDFGSGGLYVAKPETGNFRGLIDEIRIWRIALEPNNINNSGGNGNPAENFPQSLAPYINAEWSFTEFTDYGNGVTGLEDLSPYNNHLRVSGVTQIVDSKHLPFFVVNSTGDAPDLYPGDGTADAGNGEVTLRSAIMEANALAGYQIVYFYIPGNAPYIIQPGTSLPDITDSLTLDGTLQHGYSGSPVIQVNGSYGNLAIASGNSVVQGLEINSTAGYGLTISSGGGNNIHLNKISGIAVASSGNKINSNTITGSAANGIYITASGNSIGVASANDIHGNAGTGISVVNANGNMIENNTVASNSGGGISLSGSTSTLIANTISQNSNYGISLNSSSAQDTLFQNTISGNSDYGIFIDGSSNNYILQNTISDYQKSGVAVKSGVSNQILENSIYSATGIGIDLWSGTPPVEDGITVNDGNDSDTGSNNLQNYPVLEMAYASSRGAAISGTLNSVPSSSYTIQFYSTPPSTGGTRQGMTYLGEEQVTTDLYGSVDFLANIADVTVNQQDSISAIVTDNSGNTSEFSAAIALSQDEGLHYKVNTTLAGIPLHWADGNSLYSIAQSVVNNGYDAAVQNGFDTWSNLDQLTYTRASSDTSEQWGGNPDGINNVVWIPDASSWDNIVGAPSNVIAVTRVRYNAYNGELTDVDMAFNGDPISLTGHGHYEWGTDGSADTSKLDVQNTTTHEAGHYSGLADLYNPGDFNYTLDLGNNNEEATMYGRIGKGEDYKRTLMPEYTGSQSDVTTYDVGGINYIYSHLGEIYYDIALVFDGSSNFTSPDILNGFKFSKDGSISLVDHLRSQDAIGIVNGVSETYPIGSDFSNKKSILNTLNPNLSDGNLAQRITRAEQMLSASPFADHKKVIILFSAGEISNVSLITDSLALSPDINIYTMGYNELDQGQDLMSWLANKTGGEYSSIQSSDEIPSVVNFIWLRLMGLQVSYNSGAINSDMFDLNSGLSWEGGLSWLGGLSWEGGLSWLGGLSWEGGLSWLGGLSWEGGLSWLGGLSWEGASLDMGLSWEGSEYSLVLLPPGIYLTTAGDIPPGAITQDNYNDPEFADYGIELINGYASTGTPYKFFRINHPGLGSWRYALIENTGPVDTTENIRVYMANHSDMLLNVNTDQERYFVTYQNGTIDTPVVYLTAKLFEGGDSNNQSDHTITVGEPVDSALVLVRITSPDYGQTIGRLQQTSSGTYTGSFRTGDLGGYNLEIIASDGDSANGYLNSKYLITAEHSIFVAQKEKPQATSAKDYVQMALDNLNAIMDQYCSSRTNCSLDNNTKKDLNNAISSLESALGYFINGDGNRLKTNKGLTFYDNLTTASNKTYSYISNPDFGDKINEAIEWLKVAGYMIAVQARDDAEQPGACVVSNCDELLQSANTELGKAVDSLKQDNYVYVFNHLTNAWKFAENMMGANLKKSGGDITGLIPKEYALSQNYPNPFNPTTTINYQLPEKSHVTLRIYDILGNLVKTLVNGEQAPGYYNVTWNAGGFASGVYIYRLMSGSFVSTKKLILLK
jgi:parallel beta-helix repeat protein